MKLNKKEFLEKIKLTITTLEPSSKVILFGSRARGDAQPQSDWDILILIEKTKVTNEIEKTLKYPLYELEWDIGEIISPVIYSKKDWEAKYSITPFYKNVIKEGIEL